jgi:anthranilate phosphoribosyltransferase
MRDSAVFNAAAAIVAGEVADRLEDGIELAIGSIDSGRALVKLNDLIDASNRK